MTRSQQARNLGNQSLIAWLATGVIAESEYSPLAADSPTGMVGDMDVAKSWISTKSHEPKLPVPSVEAWAELADVPRLMPGARRPVWGTIRGQNPRAFRRNLRALPTAPKGPWGWRFAGKSRDPSVRTWCLVSGRSS